MGIKEYCVKVLQIAGSNLIIANEQKMVLDATKLYAEVRGINVITTVATTKEGEII